MKTAKNILWIILGNFICALGVVYFLVPAGLIAGGATGISLALHQYLGIPTSVGLWGVTFLFFGVGFLLLGKKFALSTLLSSVAYPLSFNLVELLAEKTGLPTDDILLCMIFASLIVGIGVGILIRAGASTGGSDVIAIALNRRTGLSLSVATYAIEGVIPLIQFPYSKAEQILYGILYVILYTIIFNRIIVFGAEMIQISIYSSKYEEINQVILTRFERGSTLFHVEGGYRRQEGYALETVIPRRALFHLREAVLKIDPQAFIVITPVAEVNGRGFTLGKYFEAEEEKPHE